MELTIPWKHWSDKPMSTTYRLVKHNEGVSGEWWAILRVGQNDESLKNQWGGYSTKNCGAPKYIKKIWKNMEDFGANVETQLIKKKLCIGVEI